MLRDHEAALNTVFSAVDVDLRYVCFPSGGFSIFCHALHSSSVKMTKDRREK